MNIVLLGGEVANKIAKVIKDTFDNADVVVYKDLNKFCEETSSRNMFFERMFITPDLFDDLTQHEDELEALSNYISEKYPEVRLITFSKTAEVFEINNKMFTSPIHLNIILEKLSSSKIAELVSTPIEALRGKYAKELKAQVNMSAVKKENKKNSPAPKKKKEKRGFFGFGKKSAKKAQVQYVLEDELENEENKELETSIKENENFEENVQTLDENNSDDGFGDTFEEVEDENEFNFKSIDDEEDENMVEENIEEFGEDFTDDYEDTESIAHEQSHPAPSSKNKKQVNASEVASKLNSGSMGFVDEDNDGIDDITGEVIDMTSNKKESQGVSEEPTKVEDISNVVEEIDSTVQDIVSDTNGISTEIEELGFEEPDAIDLEDANESLGDGEIEFGDINQLEEDYLVGSGKAKIIEKERVVEVEKVVEKVVEKPVYVNGSKRTASKLQLITKGVEKAIIIVTGDRRSGVTTLANKIATMFAQKLKVLYVDMDTERRGSLIHIGINGIANEDDVIQRGLELIKSSKMLPNMVYTSNATKFDSLVSIGEEQVSDEQLKIIEDILMVQDLYNVVVVDCPFEKLHLLHEMVSVSTVITCLEEDISAIKNTATFFEGIDIPLKYKRTLFNNMNYCMTRGFENKFAVMFKQVNEFFETDDEINWSDVTKVAGSTKNIVKLMEHILA